MARDLREKMEERMVRIEIGHRDWAPKMRIEIEHRDWAPKVRIEIESRD